jgi:hypothetical protein
MSSEKPIEHALRLQLSFLAQDLQDFKSDQGSKARLDTPSSPDFLCQPWFHAEQVELLRNGGLHDLRPEQHACDPDCQKSYAEYWMQRMQATVALKIQRNEPHCTAHDLYPILAAAILLPPSYAQSDSYRKARKRWLSEGKSREASNEPGRARATALAPSSPSTRADEPTVRKTGGAARLKRLEAQELKKTRKARKGAEVESCSGTEDVCAPLAHSSLQLNISGSSPPSSSLADSA